MGRCRFNCNSTGRYFGSTKRGINKPSALGNPERPLSPIIIGCTCGPGRKPRLCSTARRGTACTCAGPSMHGRQRHRVIGSVAARESFGCPLHHWPTLVCYTRNELRAPTVAARPSNAFTFMDLLDSLRQAPSAELYRLYLAIGKMLDDPGRILEVRQRLHLGMAVSYIADNPLAQPLRGTVVELRQAQAIVQDNASRRRWALPYAAIVPDSASAPIHPEPAPPPRAQREEFFVGDTVGFTDKHLSERIGIIVRLNAKTASIAVTDSEGHWRVSYGLLRRIVDL